MNHFFLQARIHSQSLRVYFIPSLLAISPSLVTLVFEVAINHCL